MRGLAEHLGLLVLQQRGAATALESDLMSLFQEVRALQSVTSDYATDNCPSSDHSTPRARIDDPETVNKQQQWAVGQDRVLPPQTPLRSALESLRQGLLRGLEAVREVQLLVKAVAASDPPSPTSSSTRESRVRMANGEEGWGETPTDAETSTEVKSSVDALENSLLEMLSDVERYPCISSTPAVGLTATPLLAAGAARVVIEVRGSLRACSADAKAASETYAGVIPRAVLERVARHLSDLELRVGSALNSPSMRMWLAADVACEVDASDAEQGREAVKTHASKVGQRLTDSVKALLLSVQALCPRDTAAAAAAGASSDVGKVGINYADGSRIGDEDQSDDASWSTDTTLFEAHASAFEQARGLKLWRCAAAMQGARLALKEFSEDEAVFGQGGLRPGGDAADVTAALMVVCAELLVLAEQVLAAGKAVLVGMVALNKVRLRLMEGLLVFCVCYVVRVLRRADIVTPLLFHFDSLPRVAQANRFFFSRLGVVTLKYKHRGGTRYEDCLQYCLRLSWYHSLSSCFSQHPCRCARALILLMARGAAVYSRDQRFFYPAAIVICSGHGQAALRDGSSFPHPSVEGTVRSRDRRRRRRWGWRYRWHEGNNAWSAFVVFTPYPYAFSWVDQRFVGIF